jgi:hypothetical protein
MVPERTHPHVERAPPPAAVGFEVGVGVGFEVGVGVEFEVDVGLEFEVGVGVGFAVAVALAIFQPYCPGLTGTWKSTPRASFALRVAPRSMSDN